MSKLVLNSTLSEWTKDGLIFNFRASDFLELHSKVVTWLANKHMKLHGADSVDTELWSKFTVEARNRIEKLFEDMEE